MLEKILKDVLAGHEISKSDAILLVDADIVWLKQAANLIREYFCSNKFDLCSIINGKSGRCSENCKYNENKGVKRFSIVTSGRRLNDQEFLDVIKIYQSLHDTTEISLCASLGLLNLEQLTKLKAAGVKRYHNNLETSRNYFPNICTTHSYQQKIETIKAAQEAGLEVCSGGIMGMNESWQDRIDLAFELKELGIKSIPINILNPIPGTPLEHLCPLSKEEVERIFAIFRFILPDAVIRMAGGRGLLEDQGLSVFKSGANAAITGDMLTTQGITIDEDQRIIKELGFEVVKL